MTKGELHPRTEIDVASAGSARQQDAGEERDVRRITSSSASLSFKSTSGYESSETWPEREGDAAIVGVLEEIGRVMTIAGRPDVARCALESVIRRTQAALGSTREDRS